jgi:hypothetical protein
MRFNETGRVIRKGFLTIPTRLLTPKAKCPRPARFKTLIRASVYVASIPALAAVLAIVATTIAAQWLLEHRATQVFQLACLP